MKRLALLALLALLAGLFVPAGLALAQGEEIPPIPAAYHGAVKNTNGEAVSAGTVEAYIEGQKYGELAFTDGYYGDKGPPFYSTLDVQGPKEILDKPVTFVIVISNQSYQAQSSPATVMMKSGEVQTVDLTIDYSAPAVTPPAVSSTDPANNATGVPVDKTIVITFSKSIQPGAAYDSIALFDSGNNSIAMTKSTGATALNLDPTANLSPKTSYTVTIPIGGVRDNDGNPNAAHTFSFTTGESSNGSSTGSSNGSSPVTQPPVIQPPVTQPPVNVSFNDLAGHWAKDSVLQLVYLDIIKGYPDNTFQPDNKITRVEATAILARALKLSPGNETELLSFSDQDSIPAWARGNVAAAVYAGLIKGYPEESDKFTFRPNNPISRAELATIAARIIVQKTGSAQAPEAAFADASTIPDWAKEGINIAASKGIITGYPDNTFKPGNEITRAETATMILRLMNLLPN